jgi:choline dehydrogenase
VLEESATPDMQSHFPGELQERPDRRARGDAGPQRRRLADAVAAARLCEAKSNRPGDAPAINPRYLSEESDRRAIIGGLGLARRIFAAPRSSAKRACPDLHVRTDDELLDYAPAQTSTPANTRAELAAGIG